MPNYAIMRCKKLSSMGSVAGSLKHNYRERETANADPAKTPQNEHHAARTTDEAMGRLRDLLPEKRRKDAVLAVEYVMTASPEWWGTATREQQGAFFDRSRQWLADKYGAQNIITATIHRDETSPHLSAFVVPLTKDGRLSAKEFIGGKAKMTADQTSYAEHVQDLGLERGQERSQARHTSIREYYGRVRAAERPVRAVDVPEPSFSERLTPKTYGDRVAKSVLQQIGPDWKRMQAKAIEVDAAKEEAKQAKAALQDLEKRLAPIVSALRPLNDQERQQLVMVVDRAKEHLLAERMKAEVERQRQQAEERQRRQEERAAQRPGRKERDSGLSR